MVVSDSLVELTTGLGVDTTDTGLGVLSASVSVSESLLELELDDEDALDLGGVTLEGVGVLGGLGTLAADGFVLLVSVSVSESLLELELELDEAFDLGGVTFVGVGVLGGVGCFTGLALSSVSVSLLELELELEEVLLDLGGVTLAGRGGSFSLSVSVSELLLLELLDDLLDLLLTGDTRLTSAGLGFSFSDSLLELVFSITMFFGFSGG